MYCPKCGSKLPDGVSTCENCGWSEEGSVSAPKTAKKSFPKKQSLLLLLYLLFWWQ